MTHDDDDDDDDDDRGIPRTGDDATAAAAAAAAAAAVLVTHALKFAEGPEAAAEIIAGALIRRISRTMRIPEPDIDVAKPIHIYSVNSLVAMELRNYLASKCSSAVTVLEIMSNKTIEVLGREMAKGSKFVQRKSSP
ncbi:hypothetical protein CTA1_3127 [Colletotrichum tanaceti]|uniref:Carrier domain-containing protein n=1 Tax=Colletotrichum tanaceti TaxID=1306861 RepID=A0A4U6XVK1_9PEZI|nr:hypothetical protein CTA1_3127 [Colletotrichum tanaceti]